MNIDINYSEFSDIPGYEGLYKINQSGNVLSLSKKRGRYIHGDRVLKNHTSTFGYYFVRLFKNRKQRMSQIHRLIALTFIENPNNFPCINHIDGNKKNNSLNNLEWCTHRQNNIHAIKTGLNPQSYKRKKTTFERNYKTQTV